MGIVALQFPAPENKSSTLFVVFLYVKKINVVVIFEIQITIFDLYTRTRVKLICSMSSDIKFLYSNQLWFFPIISKDFSLANYVV